MRRMFPLALLALGACSTPAGDDHLDAGPPTAFGAGERIRDVADPTLPNHPADKTNVLVTGATVLWVDTYDETANGKSRGTVYVQDVGSQAPYSALSLFSPTFVPGD